MRRVVATRQLHASAGRDGGGARDVGCGCGVRRARRTNQRLLVMVASELPEAEGDEGGREHEHEQVARDPTRS